MFLLPLASAFTLLGAVRLLLALTGMWLWLRELSASPEAALFGSIAFSFSFSMTPWLLFPHPGVISLWPWCLYLFERIHTPAAARRHFWALVAILALLPISGHLESVALLAGFLLLWLLTHTVTGQGPGARPLGKMAIAASLALGLSGFSLIPQALAILASNRFVLAATPLWSGSFSLLPHPPAWPNGLWTTLFPRTLGDAIQSPMIPGIAGSFPEMSLGYCGILTSVGVLLALRPGSPRNRKTITLFVPLLVGLGIGIGAWPFAEVGAKVPLLGMMLPLRFFSWVALAAPAIAALELDRLRADLFHSRLPFAASLIASVLMAALAIAAYVRFKPFHAATGGLPPQRDALTMTLIVLGAGIVVAAVATRSALALRTLPLQLAAIAAAELLYQGQQLYRSGSPAELFPQTPLTRFLAEKRPPFRVVGEGPALYPNTNVFAGLEDIRTHDPVERRDYVEFLDATCGYPPGDYFKHLRNLDAPVFDFLNVRFLVAAPGRPAPSRRWTPVYEGSDGVVFENTRTLPRAFAPSHLRYVEASQSLGSGNGVTAFGTSFRDIAKLQDWGNTAYVLRRRAGTAENGAAVVSGYRERTNQASLTVDMAPGAVTALIVTSLVQDGGWSAHDEAGHSLEVCRVNGPFLAVRVSAGRSRVHLSYLPPGIRLGTAASIGTLCLVAIYGILGRRYPRS